MSQPQRDVEMDVETDDDVFLSDRPGMQPPESTGICESIKKNPRWFRIVMAISGAGIIATIAILFFLYKYGTLDDDAPNMDFAPPAVLMSALTENMARAHIKFLSSDLLEGRGVATRGEELAVAYIASQYELSNLVPAGENGSYFQKVPLLGLTVVEQSVTEMTFKNADKSQELTYIQDFVFGSDLDNLSLNLTDENMIFVGYGINSSFWNDYKSVDVQGKILLMFVNEPPSTPEDPALFANETLTYYGRWTYKYEQARKHKAKGCILIHTNETAGYPFTVLQTGYTSENMRLDAPVTNGLEVKGWITKQKAEELAKSVGTSLDEWYKKAAKPDFTPVDLGTTVSLYAEFQSRRVNGTNVIGKVPPRKMQEGDDKCVIFTAHHDHLGLSTLQIPDKIYNGALDNASGVAGLLTLAYAFGKFSSATANNRCVMFASLTAEEQYLLGAEYLVKNLDKINMTRKDILANINYDVMNVFGRTKDIVGIGMNISDVMDVLFAKAAKEEGLIVSPDSTPGQGHYYRGDQLNFALAGIPAINPTTGDQFINKSADYFQQIVDQYNKEHYHQPSDEYDPSWSMEGLIQQARVGLRLAYAILLNPNLDNKLKIDHTSMLPQ